MAKVGFAARVGLGRVALSLACLAGAFGAGPGYAESVFPREDAPGIYCPLRQDYARAKAYPGISMEDQAINRAIARTRSFRKATACRASTACEEIYTKYGGTGEEHAKPDLQCPREPANTVAIAQYGTAQDLKRVLAAGANPNGIRRNGWATSRSPLAAAAGAGRLDNVEMLLAAHADVTRDAPLAWAIDANSASDRLKVVNRLLAAGANPNGAACGKPLPTGMTPLEVAVSIPDQAMVDALLASGASADGQPCHRRIAEFSRQPFEVASGGGGPFYGAIVNALTPRTGPGADQVRDRYRRLAVQLLAHGASLSGSGALEPWFRTPDPQVLTILVAAARKVGRDDELLDYLSNGLAIRGAGDTPAFRAVKALRACEHKAFEFAGDHVELCRSDS